MVPARASLFFASPKKSKQKTALAHPRASLHPASFALQKIAVVPMFRELIWDLGATGII